MKKILFVTTSSLDLENYTGDTIRAQNIIKYLEKDNKVDIVCLDEKKPYKKKINNSKIYFFKKNNLFLRLFYTLISLLRLKPLQIGFFYSKKIQEFLHNNHQNYDTIIFHLIRSAQYLPKKFKGKKILEMTDLMSNNYNQTKKNLSLFNFFIIFIF